MRVLVSGYYGFDNLGDEALLAGLAGGLVALGHRVAVLSQRPERSRELHGVEAVHRLAGLLPAALTTDALVSGGGGLLQDATSQRSLRYYLAVIGLGKRLGKRVVVFGQSVGPLSPGGRKAVAGALQGVAVSVRDRASQSLLAELGVEAHLGADAALLLPPRTGPAASSGTAGSSGAPVLIVPRGGYPELTPRLAEAARRLLEDGVEVAVMALQEAEDGPECERLQRAAPGVRRWRAGTPREALEQVAAAGHVVSARLHGLILAAVAGRSMSGIVYDPKVAAFLGEIGAPAHPLCPDPARLAREAAERRPLDAALVAGLVERARDGLAWLGRELES